MSKIKLPFALRKWWYETDSIEMVLFATLWSLFGYGAYVVVVALAQKITWVG